MTGEERQRVQRITDWDDARYSFMPARAADDLRLTLVHLRLLVYLGRVNNNNGWTELSQKATAERWNYARPALNGAIKQLVAWGYVEKKSQAETNTALCLYRLLIDKPEKPAPVKSSPEPKGDEGGVSSIDDTSQNAAVSSIDDTCVRSQVTPVSPIKTQKKDQRSGDPSPPKPPRGRRGRAMPSNEIEEVLVAVSAERPDDEAFQSVLVDFLAPLIRMRHLDAPSLVGAVQSLARWIAAKGLGVDEGRKILHQLLERRKSTVKPSDIETAVKTAIAHRPLPRKCEGDAELMRNWPAVLAELEKMIGADTTRQVFSTFALDRITEPNPAGKIVARVSTHADWAKRHVETNLSSQFRAAMNAVFPGVSDIWIETRKAAA